MSSSCRASCRVDTSPASTIRCALLWRRHSSGTRFPRPLTLALRSPTASTHSADDSVFAAHGKSLTRSGYRVACFLLRSSGPDVATVEDVRWLGSSLERSYEVYVRGRLRFRVKQIVYVAFSRD